MYSSQLIIWKKNYLLLIYCNTTFTLNPKWFSSWLLLLLLGCKLELNLRRKVVHWRVKSVIISLLIKLTDPFVAPLLICFVCCRTHSLKTRDESVWWVKIIPRSAVSDSVRPKPRVSLFGKRQLFCLFRSGSRLPPKTMAADSLAYLADTFNLLTGLARGGKRRMSLSREVNS